MTTTTTTGCPEVECPVCFRSYADEGVNPTTLPCGHSCCLDDGKELTRCPICQDPFNPNKLTPSYSLKEVAIMLRNLILRNASILPPSPPPQTQGSCDSKVPPFIGPIHRVPGNWLMNKNSWRTVDVYRNFHGQNPFFCYLNSHGTKIVSKAVYGDDFSIKLWSVSDGQLMATYPMTSHCKISGFIFGDRVLIATEDFIGILNDQFQSVDLIITDKSEIDFENIYKIYVTRDGSKAYCCYQSTCTIHVWDLLQKRLSVKIRDTDAYNKLYCVDMDFNERYLVSGGETMKVKLWNATNGSLVKVFNGHRDCIWSVKFNHNASKIVSGSGYGDATVIIWDIGGSILFRLTGHSNDVMRVSWSSDGAIVLSASYDGTVKLWNSSTGSLIQSLEGHGSLVEDFGIADYSTKIITYGAGEVRVWS